MPKEQIAKATGIILLGTIIGKVAGFLREVLIAKYFGASRVTDAYLIAYNIPMVFLGMVMGGGIYAALVPTFTTYLVKKEYKIMWRLSSVILSYAGLISIVIVGIVIIFAPYLVKCLGYGLGKETFELAVKLTKVMAPMVIFLALGGIFIGILHAFQHFTVPSFNAFILGTTVILSILLLGEKLGIFSVGIGLVVGSGVMFLAPLIVLFTKGMKYSFNFNLKYPEMKEFIRLFLPATAGTTIMSCYPIISRMMASPLPEGSIASLDFAYMVMQASLSTFSLAISTAVFPFIASYAAIKSYSDLRGTMSKGIRMTMLIYIPMQIIFMILCQPIIRLLFERGNFDVQDTMMTSKALFFYSLGMTSLAVNYVLLRVFYALHDSITPTIVAIGSIVLHIILNFILIKYLAHAGIAFSYSIVQLGSIIILSYLLKQKIGNIGAKQILNSLLKMIISVSPTMAICLAISKYIGGILDISRIEFQILQVGSATIIGVACYLIILGLLKADELKMIMELIKSKFKKEVLK